MLSLVSLNKNMIYNEQNSSQIMAVIESHIKSELAAYLGDSVIKIDLSQEKGFWTADVVVDFNREVKASRRTDDNVQRLVQHIIEDLKTQFELTNTNIKNELFMFDHQQEYDYYTETLASPSKPVAKSALKVLVLEDDPTASLILEKSLQSMGCKVDLFNNPEKAIDQLLTTDYDLLILDWCLPYMSGHEFLKQVDSKLTVKNLGNFNPKTIPLVVCSSKNSDEINLPLVSNFLFCQYWNKQLPFSTVVSSIETAISSANTHKTRAA